MDLNTGKELLEAFHLPTFIHEENDVARKKGTLFKMNTLKAVVDPVYDAILDSYNGATSDFAELEAALAELALGVFQIAAYFDMAFDEAIEARKAVVLKGAAELDEMLLDGVSA